MGRANLLHVYTQEMISYSECLYSETKAYNIRSRDRPHSRHSTQETVNSHRISRRFIVTTIYTIQTQSPPEHHHRSKKHTTWFIGRCMQSVQQIRVWGYLENNLEICGIHFITWTHDGHWAAANDLDSLQNMSMQTASRLLPTRSIAYPLRTKKLFESHRLNCVRSCWLQVNAKIGAQERDGGNLHNTTENKERRKDIRRWQYRWKIVGFQTKKYIRCTKTTSTGGI